MRLHLAGAINFCAPTLPSSTVPDAFPRPLRFSARRFPQTCLAALARIRNCQIALAVCRWSQQRGPPMNTLPLEIILAMQSMALIAISLFLLSGDGGQRG